MASSRNGNKQNFSNITEDNSLLTNSSDDNARFFVTDDFSQQNFNNMTEDSQLTISPNNARFFVSEDFSQHTNVSDSRGSQITEDLTQHSDVTFNQLPFAHFQPLRRSTPHASLNGLQIPAIPCISLPLMSEVPTNFPFAHFQPIRRSTPNTSTTTTVDASSVYHSAMTTNDTGSSLATTQLNSSLSSDNSCPQVKNAVARFNDTF